MANNEKSFLSKESPGERNERKELKDFPAATYRLQLNRDLSFNKAASLTDYLSRLGISDVYASPFLRARKGSAHGYDVVDPSSVNEEIGSLEEWEEWISRLKNRGMGLVLDIVPNHMCITDPSNRWWFDILENGPSSPYSTTFDIDWQPLKIDLANKVLLPVLGDQYGKVLENQQIQVFYDQGAFFIEVYDHRLPTAPRSWLGILQLVLDGSKNNTEMESIMTALRHLPLQTETEIEKVRERQREKEVIKKRLAELTHLNPPVGEAIAKALKELNGTPGNPRSFDKLEAFLNEQAYRLCYWRVAADEINYRRFFDINELAAIRVEEPHVFQAMHELPLQWAKEGKVRGFRIDHVDGLYDPKQYLLDLKSAMDPLQQKTGFYTVVEKILEGSEKLMPDWPVQGTTGYDFLNQLNGLFVDPNNRSAFFRIYQEFTGFHQTFADVAATSKKLIMLVSNASELRVLANMLDRISEQHRWSRDFTLESQRFALREVIAYFPVYRTYLRPSETQVSAHDRQVVESAIREAKRHNPATDPSVFDFIRSVLLLEDPEGLDESQISLRRHFVMRFQQLTAPIMAKGMEDTAFYRYYPLSSLNEVGGRPDKFGITVEEFHRRNAERAQAWPHSLLATTTHDTKRSEDVRARLNVLSEMPAKWYRSIGRWNRWNEGFKTDLEGTSAPDRSQEYLLYQTLAGTWPSEPLSENERKSFIERIKTYMLKAAREAKTHTSWIKANDTYEKALVNFVDLVLKSGADNKFLDDFVEFVKPIQFAGFFNSLSQVLLKAASPGIPDFYQGTETWNFSLVDPDNRRPVDYKSLEEKLIGLGDVGSGQNPNMVSDLLKNPGDGRIKLFVTAALLRFRGNHKELFSDGEYLPLPISGPRETNVCAFARRHQGKTALAVAGRFFTQMDLTGGALTPETWKDTALILDPAFSHQKYRDVLTGKTWTARSGNGRPLLFLKEVLSPLPVALLEGL